MCSQCAMRCNSNRVAWFGSIRSATDGIEANHIYLFMINNIGRYTLPLRIVRCIIPSIIEGESCVSVNHRHLHRHSWPWIQMESEMQNVLPYPFGPLQLDVDHTEKKRQKAKMLCGAPDTIAGPLSLSQRRLFYTENGQISGAHAIVTAVVLRCAAVNNIISVYTVHGVQSEF